MGVIDEFDWEYLLNLFYVSEVLGSKAKMPVSWGLWPGSVAVRIPSRVGYLEWLLSEVYPVVGSERGSRVLVSDLWARGLLVRRVASPPPSLRSSDKKETSRYTNPRVRYPSSASEVNVILNKRCLKSSSMTQGASSFKAQSTFIS